MEGNIECNGTKVEVILYRLDPGNLQCITKYNDSMSYAWINDAII